MARKKLIKEKCEVCGMAEPKILQLHHIVERTEPNCTNEPENLVILCPSCHLSHHNGLIKILFVYPSTELPNKRTLIYEKDGKKNLDIDQPYCVPKNKSYKI